MAHRMLRDAEADGWERSDFPIICESCLGPNPYVRMTKAEYDKECKICARPFTVFRWRPGRDARYKKSEICQTCSKLKNVCQVCLLDLEYGLPVEVRDQALGIEGDSIPQSNVNREYFAEQHERNAKAGLDFESSYRKIRPNDTILKLQRTTPYYKRNRPHICSFFVKGECNRGDECPYRHEMPSTGELAHQNLKDRYYGVNDPVARKLMRKAEELPSLEPPEDQTISTLYVGGVDPRLTEQDLRDEFYAYGEIASVRMVTPKGCAFITYTTREGAEKAAERLAHRLVVKGCRLKLMWGRPQQPRLELEDRTTRLKEGEAGTKESEEGPGGAGRDGDAGGEQTDGGDGTDQEPSTVPGAVSQPQPSDATSEGQERLGQGGAESSLFNLPAPLPPAPIGPGQGMYYPSMDPRSMGSARDRWGGAALDGGGQEEEGKRGEEQAAPPRQQWQPQMQQFLYQEGPGQQVGGAGVQQLRPPPPPPRRPPQGQHPSQQLSQPQGGQMFGPGSQQAAPQGAVPMFGQPRAPGPPHAVPQGPPHSMAQGPSSHAMAQGPPYMLPRGPPQGGGPMYGQVGGPMPPQGGSMYAPGTGQVPPQVAYGQAPSPLRPPQHQQPPQQQLPQLHHQLRQPQQQPQQHQQQQRAGSLPQQQYFIHPGLTPPQLLRSGMGPALPPQAMPFPRPAAAGAPPQQRPPGMSNNNPQQGLLGRAPSMSSDPPA